MPYFGGPQNTQDFTVCSTFPMEQMYEYQEEKRWK